MRIGLKVGLLAAFIACGAFVAAKAQDEKSYLPPGWSQGHSETTVNKARTPRTVHARPVRHASVHPRRHLAAVHPYHRRIRVAHHWRYYRPHYAYYRPHYAYYPRYAYYRPFPGFLSGLFW